MYLAFGSRYVRSNKRIVYKNPYVYVRSPLQQRIIAPTNTFNARTWKAHLPESHNTRLYSTHHVEYNKSTAAASEIEQICPTNSDSQKITNQSTSFVDESLPWGKGKRVPAKFWRNKDNARAYFIWLARKLNFESMEDLYRITTADLLSNGGRGLMKLYGESAVQALIATFPEHKWLPWKFTVIRSSWWSDPQHQREYINWVSEQLGIQKLEEWYKVTNGDIMRLAGGNSFLFQFGNSIRKALVTLYPEHQWELHKFEAKPWDHWGSEENQRKFLDSIKEQLGVHKMEDWYKVSATEVGRLGGRGCLLRYNGSLIRMLQTLYPKHTWHIWKFRAISKSYWKDIENVRNFLENVAPEIGVTKLEDWYSVNSVEFKKKYGISGLFAHYGNSLAKMLAKVYPRHEWQAWKFLRTSSTFWQRLMANPELGDEFLRSFVKEMEEKLFIGGNLDNWYRVSHLDIRTLVKDFSRVERFGSLLEILRRVYPDHNWDPQKMKATGKRSGQRLALEMLQRNIPNQTAIEHYILEGATFNTTQQVELDIYLKPANLAIEFQGAHHYFDISAVDEAKVSKQRDSEKAAICAARGIDLVEIPFWWNRQVDELFGFIHAVRPDLVPEQHYSKTVSFNKPIQTRLPAYLASRIKWEKQFMLAEDWNESIDPSGWWITEKFDGVRVMWTGNELKTRSGLVLNPPQSFISGLPEGVQLDCELWAGYGNYSHLIDIVNSSLNFGTTSAKTKTRKKAREKDLQHSDANWSNVKLWVIDLPSCGEIPYENRMALLDEINLGPQAQVVPRQQCSGIQHLRSTLQAIIDRGGEGIILRKSRSRYLSGRTDSMLKVKMYKDVDMTVLGIYPRRRSLLCQDDNGKYYSVCCSKEIYSSPPPKGTRITVRSTGQWNDVQAWKNPVFVRVRAD